MNKEYSMGLSNYELDSNPAEFYNELEDLGAQLQKLPENLPAEKNKRIQEKLMLIIGPLAVFIGAAAMMENVNTPAPSSFEQVTQLVQNVGSLGAMGIGLATFMRGLTKYGERNHPWVDQVNNFLTKFTK